MEGFVDYFPLNALETLVDELSISPAANAKFVVTKVKPAGKKFNSARKKQVVVVSTKDNSPLDKPLAKINSPKALFKKHKTTKPVVIKVGANKRSKQSISTGCKDPVTSLHLRGSIEEEDFGPGSPELLVKSRTAISKNQPSPDVEINFSSLAKTRSKPKFISEEGKESQMVKGRPGKMKPKMKTKTELDI